MCISYRLFQQIYLEKPGCPLQHSSDCGAAYFYWIRLLMFHRCRYHVHDFRYGTFRKSKVSNQMSVSSKELMKHVYLDTDKDWLSYYTKRRAQILYNFSSSLPYIHGLG